MIAVSLLIFDEVIPSSVTDVLDLLNGTNRYLEQTGKAPAFFIQLVREHMENKVPDTAIQLICHKTYRTVKHTDLVIIPPFNVTNDTVLARNKAGIQWLRKMKERGTEIASLCAGSYFLAEAGLLEGKEVTYHCAVIGDMKKRYPGLS